MKHKLLPIFLGVGVSLATLGYLLSWYTVSIANRDHQVEIHVTIYKDKIKADEERAKEKLDKYEQQFKEERPETARRTGGPQAGQTRPEGRSALTPPARR